MAGGGGRPCCPQQALLGVVAIVAVVAEAQQGAPGAARAAPEEEQLSVGFFQKNVVYGNDQRAENVYVKVFTNSPTLVCMDLTLSQDEVIDPRYSWTGPDGRNLEGQGYANLTSSGELVLLGFQESMSGAYKCVLSHRIIETSTQKEVAVTNTYRFMVYAYREANQVYQVSVRFTSKGCELAANTLFVEELKRILEDLISELMSRVEQLSHRCHSLEVPHRGSPSELFITFQAHRWSQNAAAALGARRAKRSSKTPKPPGEFSPVPPPTPRHISSHLPIAAPDPGGTNRSRYGAAPPLSLSETNTQQTGSFSQSSAGQRRRGGEIPVLHTREGKRGGREGGGITANTEEGGADSVCRCLSWNKPEDAGRASAAGDPQRNPRGHASLPTQ
ncbi:zona pellucida-binding protein 2 isoform X1 [Centrocercus urophasianus]|uniref:zona pellucida-binding protein 2 isoform X1 n=1 Tax=Centrocercus urophasianus TaxID=9002 RepID=UPI001C646495|nr:zona pellucida-binding protein 2 isoform X1 [Centrocercus urophasianus]